MLETKKSNLASPQEELDYLKAEVRQREQALSGAGEGLDRDKVTKDVLLEYQKIQLQKIYHFLQKIYH